MDVISWLIYLSGLICVIIALIYVNFRYAYQYWKNYGIPYFEPTFPFGNSYESLLLIRNLGELMKERYLKMKAKGEQHFGLYIFQKPAYVPVSIELVKNILARDFQHFHDRNMFDNEKNNPLSAHLFSLRGLRWKNLRNKLTPTFTSGKMKKMFQTLVDCSDDLKNCLNNPVSKGEPIDIRPVLAQYTTDVIGSCAFGIDCNSFENPNNEFAQTGKKIFKMGTIQRIKITLAMSSSWIRRFIKFKFLDVDVENFYMSLVRETVEYREKNNINRNDFMDLLIQLKNKGFVEGEGIQTQDVNTKLTFNEIAAQAFLFFIAGFETSSTTMSFALYQLSLAQDIQQKAREEIISVLKKHDGKITYEAINEMHYLDRVVQESLRIHPPVMTLQRVCTKDYQVPDTNYTMTKGTNILIPVMGIHYDPEYYPDPTRFDPDRFTEENKATRPDYAFLPFGEGPRVCIGLRFGMMQSKVGLCRLLQNYKFTLNAKTIHPIQLEPAAFISMAKGGIWLDAERFGV